MRHRTGARYNFCPIQGHGHAVNEKWALRKILVTDDHALTRMGLVRLVNRMLPEAVVLEARTRLETLQTLSRHPDVDLLLLDLGLPDAHGLRVLEEVFAARPQLPVVVVSAQEDARLARRALGLGAMGYVPKSADPAVTENALRLIMSGGRYLPPFAFTAGDTARPAPAGLTERQRDVLALICKGLSNKQIANELGLTEATIKGHLTTVFRVLKVNSRSQAIVAARVLELIPPA